MPLKAPKLAEEEYGMQIPVVRNVLEANEKMAAQVRERLRGILEDIAQED